MVGKKLGNFDLYYDRNMREQIVIGKLNTRDNVLYFDVWTSFVAKSFRNRPITPDLTLDGFRIEAALQPDLNLSVVTRVKAKPSRAALPVLAFDIAHPMRISAVLVDGRPAEVRITTTHARSANGTASTSRGESTASGCGSCLV